MPKIEFVGTVRRNYRHGLTPNEPGKLKPIIIIIIIAMIQKIKQRIVYDENNHEQARKLTIKNK